MRAIVRDRYGPPEVLALEQIDRPVPRNGEVLIRVRASSLNRADRYVMQGIPAPIRFVTGLFRPNKRGLGMDVAGDIEQLGAEVTDLRVGDVVYGQVDFGETWAEYAIAPGSLLAAKPERLTYEEAAAVPLAALTALQGLRDHGRVEPGQAVLVNGATGAVGPFAVQIARALGAEVTAVCSARNVDWVRALGAAEVIPYETEDFTACGRQFDVLFDVAGNRSLRDCRKVMKPKAVYLPVGGPIGRWMGPMTHLIGVMLQAPLVSQRVASFTGTPNRKDLLALTELIDAGQITPAICRRFPLEEAADAMRYLIEGHPPSKVVITM